MTGDEARDLLEEIIVTGGKVTSVPYDERDNVEHSELFSQWRSIVTRYYYATGVLK